MSTEPQLTFLNRIQQMNPFKKNNTRKNNAVIVTPSPVSSFWNRINPFKKGGKRNKTHRSRKQKKN